MIKSGLPPRISFVAISLTEAELTTGPQTPCQGIKSITLIGRRKHVCRVCVNIIKGKR